MKHLAMVGFCWVMVAVVSRAQEAPADAFKTRVSLGLSLTDGNSETMLANASVVSEGERDGLGSFRTGLEANYGESTVDGENEKTVENARLFANTRKTLTDRTFLSLDGSLAHDAVADVDYRAVVGLGAGVYLVKNAAMTLSVEVAPSYLWERVAEVTDDYFALRFSERFEYAFSETARGWQALDYMPKAEDFGDYLLSAEVGVEAALNASVAVRVVLQNKYDSTPGAELEKNDLALIAGVSLNL